MVKLLKQSSISLHRNTRGQRVDYKHNEREPGHDIQTKYRSDR